MHEEWVGGGGEGEGKWRRVNRFHILHLRQLPTFGSIPKSRFEKLLALEGCSTHLSASLKNFIFFLDSMGVVRELTQPTKHKALDTKERKEKFRSADLGDHEN